MRACAFSAATCCAQALLDSSAVVADAVEEASVRLGDDATAGRGRRRRDRAPARRPSSGRALARRDRRSCGPEQAASRPGARRRERRRAPGGPRPRRPRRDLGAARRRGGGCRPRGAGAGDVLGPRDLPPERWEDPDGDTAVWPPTPDQALRCEPVTADDYATRARAVDGVRRAWAVAGALPGLAWHRGATVVTDRAGTVTMLVERDPDVLAQLTDDELAAQGDRRGPGRGDGAVERPGSPPGAR